jgi:quercetin dioxygenase-like cupin family protein
VHRLRPGDRHGDRAALRRVDLSEAGRRIDRFGSVDAFVRGVSRDVLQVAVIRIDPGGVVERHPAGCPQLFAVVQGSGWVSGEDGRRESIAAGQAVAWDEGEEHESGSHDGMTALVVEAERLDV